MEAVSRKMNIPNSMSFKASSQGMASMMGTLSDCLASYHEDRIKEEGTLSREERIAYRKKIATSFFHPDSSRYKERRKDENEPY